MGLVRMSWGAPFPPPQILKHQHLTVLSSPRGQSYSLKANSCAKPRVLWKQPFQGRAVEVAAGIRGIVIVNLS
jgi:hypothetical protein